MGILGVIAFVVALLFSVMVHEFGHYITAKRYGMKVTEFFLGFGQRIWSTTRGETEFGIKVIPAGGYCKIVGMSPREELAPEDSDRAFYKASSKRRLVVLGAGSFNHFVLGIFLLFLLIAGIGTSQVLPTVEETLPCIRTTETVCLATSAPSPAKVAGILADDQIVGINGKENLKWSEIVPIIRQSSGKEITLSILRNGEKLAIAVTPVQITSDGKSWGIIGVRNKVGLVRENPISASKVSLLITKDLVVGSVKALVSLPTQIPSIVRQTFGGEARNANGLVGIVGVARVSAQTASSGALTLPEKIASFVLIVASLNIFIGIFNLLPILPLDGGHMAIAIVEGVRRKIALARGKLDPGPIDVERLTPITMLVFVLLAALTLLLLAADIFNPISLGL